MFKAFIFDMDGVIIDSEPIHFEVDILTMRHYRTEISKEQLERFVGMTNPEMWTILIEEYKLSQSVAEIIDYQLSTKIKILKESPIAPIDGIVDLLRELKQLNVPIGLASSSPRLFIAEVLSKFQIEHYFSSIVSGEEVENGKPAPDVFLEAAKLLGVSPSDCVVIEDSRNGIRAAKAAGMKCIGYVNENSGNQDLTAADRVVTSIRDINLDQLEL
ncbi:HAD family hydrolase [Cohnella herbarum]|uniref:HAD family phosphatase n=1 Tax=Cohnella herbarum TaxID=2728023 RepID=A0A7Z2ZKA5_9BACL|nr:HAD family phosphatase [Cohnella herbarum]QJD82640.1 HAD family phosphatase [Cohnella herbarum]